MSPGRLPPLPSLFPFNEPAPDIQPLRGGFFESRLKRCRWWAPVVNPSAFENSLHFLCGDQNSPVFRDRLHFSRIHLPIAPRLRLSEQLCEFTGGKSQARERRILGHGRVFGGRSSRSGNCVLCKPEYLRNRILKSGSHRLQTSIEITRKNAL